MEDSNLLVLATFILLLAMALLGLFIYLVKSMRHDSRLTITRLQAIISKIRMVDNVNDRTFKEFESLMNRRLRDIFTKRIVPSAECGAQTDFDEDLELGTQDVALQTDLDRVCSLPPLMVRPALSSDVVIPIATAD